MTMNKPIQRVYISKRDPKVLVFFVEVILAPPVIKLDHVIEEEAPSS